MNASALYTECVCIPTVSVYLYACILPRDVCIPVYPKSLYTLYTLYIVLHMVVSVYLYTIPLVQISISNSD